MIYFEDKLYPLNLDNLYVLMKPEKVNEYINLVLLRQRLEPGECGKPGRLIYANTSLFFKGKAESGCDPGEVEAKTNISQGDSATTFTTYFINDSYPASIIEIKIVISGEQINALVDTKLQCKDGNYL